MSLQFVLGPSGHGKSTYVRKQLIAEAQLHRDRDYLMIVPDQFTMQTQMIMSKESPQGGILNIDVLSFGRLSHRIFKEVGRPERIMLDDLGKVLILRRVIQEQESSLSVLKKGIHRPGYVEEVKSVLSEFMQYNIRPADLEKQIEELPLNPGLKGKLEDFRILYKAFLEALEEQYTTKEETLSCLSERIPFSALIKRSTLVFDGFTGFTPLQLTVISALLQNAQDIIITLPYGNDPKESGSADDLFYLSEKTIRDISAIAKDLGIPVKEHVWQTEFNRFEAAPAVAYLERNLFRLNEAPYPFEPEEIHITKASDETHECRILCRQMFDLIREKNYRYRDMAVVCADLETYREALKEQFEKYGIPYFLDATTDLTANPFVGYIQAVLQVLIGNYAPEDVNSLLKSAFLQIPEGQADKLDNYITARNIRGKTAWHKDFKTADKRNRKMFDRLPEEKREAAKKEYFEKLNEVRKKFADIFLPFEGLSAEKGTAREYLTALYNVIENGKAANILFNMARSFEEEGEQEKALEYDQVYKLVMDLFDRIVSLIGDDEISLKELKEILDTGFGEIRVGIIPGSVDVLPVCDLIRSRFGEIKVLFFLGVNDGNIPANGAGGGLLSDLERSTLLNLGVELAPNRTMESFAQKLYLYQVLTKPTEGLYLSYLTITEAGKSRLPSYLIGEFKELFPKLKVNDETMSVKQLSGEGIEKTFKDHNILSRKDLYSEFALRLGDYANGSLSEEEMEYTRQLFAALQGDEETLAEATALIHAAFDSYSPKPLNQEIAKKLYGGTMLVSISSLEKFASCAYAHFLTYGLRLSERETAEVRSLDYGNIMHSCMEKFGQQCKEQGKDIKTLSEAESDEILGKIVSELFTDESDLLTIKTKENPYLRSRLEKILKRSVEAAKRQLEHGDFVPIFHEWPFKRVINDRGDAIRGQIDRVDLCETGENVYVKVVDYKSGSKDYDDELFDLGVQIQTVVYLNEAIHMLKKQGEDALKPAALFYYKLQDPYLKEDKVSAELEKSRFGILAPTGLFVAENEVLDHLENNVSAGKSEAVPASFYANGTMYSNKSGITSEEMENTLKKAEEKVLTAVDEIAMGKIDVSPLELDRKYSSCTYCPFRSACGFDEKIGGYKKRRGTENAETDEDGEDDNE